MDTAAAASIVHKPFCLPRPGEGGPRIESFTAERTDASGNVTSRPLVTRCVECAAQVVEG